MYNVERIVDKKTENGETLYRIKWKGWKLKDSTWEPLENLNNIDEMISEFDSKFKEKINKKNPHVGRSDKNSKSEISLCIDDSDEQNDTGKDDCEVEGEELFNCKKTSDAPKKKGRGRPKGSTKSTAITKDDSSDADESPPTTKVKKNKTKKLPLDVEMDGEIQIPKEKEVNYENDLGDMQNVNYSVLDTSQIAVGSSITIEMPEKILSAKSNKEGEIYFLCQWKSKKDGQKLADCYVENDSIRTYFPKLLIDFYQSKMFSPQK